MSSDLDLIVEAMKRTRGGSLLLLLIAPGYTVSVTLHPPTRHPTAVWVLLGVAWALTLAVLPSFLRSLVPARSAAVRWLRDRPGDVVHVEPWKGYKPGNRSENIIAHLTDSFGRKANMMVRNAAFPAVAAAMRRLLPAATFERWP
jgi:hypothetical protein